MSYTELQIPGNLKNTINSIWTLKDGYDYSHPKKLKTIADIRPGLIFQDSNIGVFNKDKKQLPPVFLYGATTKHSQIELKGKHKTIGLFFDQTSLKTVFGLNANELTNDYVNLDDLPASKGFQLTEKLLNCTSIVLQIEILKSFVHSQVLKNEKYTNQKVKYALSEINSSKGSIALKELSTKLNLTERNLERKFKEFVGVSPKLYSRITRFQKTLNQLQSCKYRMLSDVAFNNSFADQSHFNRDFKEFTGVTPSQYLSFQDFII